MKRALLFVGAALLITLVVVFVVMRRSPATPTTNTSTNTTGTGTTTTAAPVRDESPAGKDQSEAQATARIVAERLGSYSSESIGAVVPELAGYMTANGQRDAEGFIALERQRLAQAASAVSITTTALATVVKQFRTESTATFELQMRRVEQVGQQPATTTQPTLSIGLVKRDGRWQVEDATWQ